MTTESEIRAHLAEMARSWLREYNDGLAGYHFIQAQHWIQALAWALNFKKRDDESLLDWITRASKSREEE